LISSDLVRLYPVGPGRPQSEVDARHSSAWRRRSRPTRLRAPNPAKRRHARSPARARLRKAALVLVLALARVSGERPPPAGSEGAMERTQSGPAPHAACPVNQSFAAGSRNSDVTLPEILATPERHTPSRSRQAPRRIAAWRGHPFAAVHRARRHARAPTTRQFQHTHESIGRADRSSYVDGATHPLATVRRARAPRRARFASVVSPRCRSLVGATRRHSARVLAGPRSWDLPGTPV